MRLPHTRNILTLCALATTAATALLPNEALADHIVYIDFSNMSMSRFGAHAAVCSAQSVVEDLIVQEVAKDMARFEILVTRVQPSSASYSHVRFDELGGGTTYGIANDGFAWESAGVLDTQIHLDTFAGQPELQGTDGTCSRISTALAGTISHEVGHNLFAFHENSRESCPSAVGAPYGPNWDEMIMARPTMAMRATVDRTFHNKCSGAVIEQEAKPRGWHLLSGDFVGGAEADSLEVNPQVASLTATIREVNAGTISGSPSIISLPGPESLLLVGDFNGNGWSDILVGEVLSSGLLEWTTYLNSGGTGSFTTIPAGVWGRVGDRFRVGNVTGDTQDEFVRGKFDEVAGKYDWEVRPFDDSGNLDFPTLWLVGVGDPVDNQALADTNGDGKADLVDLFPGSGVRSSRKAPYCDALDPAVHAWLAADGIVCRLSSDTYPTEFLDLDSYASTGTAFAASPAAWNSGFAGWRTDLSWLQDWDGDGDADLVQSSTPQVLTGATPQLYVFQNVFGTHQLASTSTSLGTAGGVSLGVLFRPGDRDGDGVIDFAAYAPVSGGHAWTWLENLGYSTLTTHSWTSYLSTSNDATWYY